MCTGLSVKSDNSVGQRWHKAHPSDYRLPRDRFDIAMRGIVDRVVLAGIGASLLCDIALFAINLSVLPCAQDDRRHAGSSANKLVSSASERTDDLSRIREALIAPCLCAFGANLYVVVH